MADDQNAVTIYNNNAISNNKNKPKNQFSVKVSLAQMLRGGAIVQVTSLDQAKTAESAGACCLTVTESTRMPDPSLVKTIQRSVSIPVMARCRVGHFVEAQILESVGVDYVDENEVMGSLADSENFVNKHNFRVPFVCGCRDLGEALRRVREGAAMIRTQGLGDDLCETVGNVRNVMGKIRVLSNMDEDEVFAFAKEVGAPYDILAQTKQMGRLPVVHFASGGIVTPADAALMMQLGCDGVFVGNEVFECLDPYRNVRAIVEAVRNNKADEKFRDLKSDVKNVVKDIDGLKKDYTNELLFSAQLHRNLGTVEQNDENQDQTIEELQTEAKILREEIHELKWEVHFVKKECEHFRSKFKDVTVENETLSGTVGKLCRLVKAKFGRNALDDLSDDDDVFSANDVSSAGPSIGSTGDS